MRYEPEEIEHARRAAVREFVAATTVRELCVACTEMTELSALDTWTDLHSALDAAGVLTLADIDAGTQRAGDRLIEAREELRREDAA